MTKAPDRIWAWPENTPSREGAYSSINECESKETCYILSTPAREAAEELLDALELLTGHAAFDDPQYLSLQLNERLDKARAAIAKAKGTKQ